MLAILIISKFRFDITNRLESRLVSDALVICIRL